MSVSLGSAELLEKGPHGSREEGGRTSFAVAEVDELGVDLVRQLGLLLLLLLLGRRRHGVQGRLMENRGGVWSWWSSGGAERGRDEQRRQQAHEQSTNSNPGRSARKPSRNPSRPYRPHATNIQYDPSPIAHRSPDHDACRWPTPARSCEPRRRRRCPRSTRRTQLTRRPASSSACSAP